MLRNAWCLALAAAAFLAAGGPARAQSQPAEMLKAIYDRVTVFCNGDEVEPPYVDKFMRATFEKAVADRYIARQSKTQIDFDIFVDGQDCKLTNLAIEPQEAAADKAVVRVRLHNFDQARTIDFQFRNAGGAWMISDMIYRHRKFTLRSFLKLNP